MNFTKSKIWKQSNRVRFNIENVVELSGIDFLIQNENIECLQYFDISFDENLINLIKSTAINGKKASFKYINLSLLEENNLRALCEKRGLKLVVNDEWQAPQLELKIKFENYIKTCSDQIRRDYTKYKTDKDLTYKIFNNDDLKLWTDVLEIDKKSWKGEKSCDMKSLRREDLQYIFYLTHSLKNSSLVVSYYQDIPVAYSLWLKGEGEDLWYAAKWGASSFGRTKNAGIKTLFFHIELMQKGNLLRLDFWGRRNHFYDLLKNTETRRCHFTIRGEHE